MMNPSTTNLWDRVKEAYRRACELQISGKAADADHVLQEEVLPLFAEWSLQTGCDADHRRLFIENLSRQERRRVESAWVKHHIEARTRRTELEQSLHRERTNLQREWAAQASIGQHFAAAACAISPETELPVPSPDEVLASSEPAMAPPPVEQPALAAAPESDRIPLDDMSNVIDYVLRQHQARAEKQREAVA